MRFIGNKENLLETIHFIFKQKGISGKSFFDFFSGTTSVAKFFKKLNYQVFSSDLLYCSYCLQQAYIKNNETPLFTAIIKKLNIKKNSLISTPLSDVVNYLNSLSSKNGFIYKNYSVGGTIELSQPRSYFSDDNAKKIDSIRQTIENWYIKELITQSEYYILLACLIESVPFYANISGVYAAFQKKWDPRALKPFELRAIETINNSKDNFVYNINSLELVRDINIDILYLDPPYNARQYAPNYHLLETIAKYDNPKIKGITGMREYSEQKSSFCNKTTAIKDLDYIAKNAKYKFLVLSYNSEGIMQKETILKTLNQYGKAEVVEFDYLRFKSNNNGKSKTKKHIQEQLYILKK